MHGRRRLIAEALRALGIGMRAVGRPIELGVDDAPVRVGSRPQPRANAAGDGVGGDVRQRWRRASSSGGADAHASSSLARLAAARRLDLRQLDAPSRCGRRPVGRDDGAPARAGLLVA
jgi:hypothetical protein